MSTVQILVTLLAWIALSLAAPTFPGLGCNFEEKCVWKWNSSDWVVTEHARLPPDYPGGPSTDADSNVLGHFLFLLLRSPRQKELYVTSPVYVSTGELCKLELGIHMSNMSGGNFKVVIEPTNAANSSWIVAEKRGNDTKTWDKYSLSIGRIRQAFRFIIEVAPSGRYGRYPSHLAIDNIKLVDCFKEDYPKQCSNSMFKCSDSSCIDLTSVCDMKDDCPDGGDEEQDCDKIPEGTRCNFENGMCGWINRAGNTLNWDIHTGSTETASTGPSFDHTYMNLTGKYAYIDVSKGKYMGAHAILESPIFNPPPPVVSNSTSRLFHSCFITFYFHQYGPHSGSLTLTLTELNSPSSTSPQEKEIWRSFGDQGDRWHRIIRFFPYITQKYYLHFEGKRSYSVKGDVAIDDFSMSPTCFGIGNITEEELNGYNYTTAGLNYAQPSEKVINQAFKNKTYYNFTTCGVSGMTGPRPENCTMTYNNTNINVTVLTDKLYYGIQKWTVPSDGFYTIIAKGAGGGRGAGRIGLSKGAEARMLTTLSKGQQLYILVGQSGSSAALKIMNISSRPSKISKLKEIKTIKAIGGGGGGGGASYVFTLTKKGERIPLLVGAGGGGLAHGPFADDSNQHGHQPNKSIKNQTGDAFGDHPAGAGGGWLPGNYTHRDITGLALVQGGTGGKACYNFIGHGGFGGGGGGCTAGGGGGGFAGGRAWAEKSRNGEGGYSWIGPQGSVFSQNLAIPGTNKGHGMVIIIPAVEGCDCDYLCAALDDDRSSTVCVCPPGWVLANDTYKCLLLETPERSPTLKIIITLIAAVIIMSLIIGAFFFFLYNRYQQMNATKFRRKVPNGPDLQLSRLRDASDNMMTEYNPNYEFGGGTYTIRDLKDVPREQLRLVKALGQGAFGEVYQGFYRHRAGDAVEMPVAVKTLPELSTNQAETDFLMEALIMSKFNHPNIVHFIGVCFDKHPRFIVIELLAGGDLKSFLRESRPKPERSSSLTMKDLLLGCMDIAKGCKYMEDNRFIHRDIAARNCLLTTKGPGRVVKIADFGMARDIYRADYYRKGGKAMLPIKWMPPEAFLDGIFTSKTDIWSFGVLLWEVMSLGYMPYTGCANREVMQLVTSGGRLEPPSNCPSPIYAIMTQCWHPNPDERPTFGLIMERLGYCIQDPEVIKAPLPVFYRPPSTERDATIMRPPMNDDCLQTDYLIPLGSGLLESKSTQPLLDQSNNNIKPPIPYVNVAVSQDQGPFIVSAHTHNSEIPC